MMGAVISIHTVIFYISSRKFIFPWFRLSQLSYSFFFVNYKRLNKITICESHGDYVRNGYGGELRLIGYCWEMKKFVESKFYACSSRSVWARRVAMKLLTGGAMEGISNS